MKRAGVYRLAGFAVWISTLPAWASEDHAAGEKGLPQMDATLFPGLLFWLVVTFALFFAVMKLVAVPGVQKVKARRKNVIDTDLSAARLASEDARAIMDVNEKALEEARVKAQKTVNDIVQAANDESAEQSEKQRKELAHRLQVAQDNLTAAKDTAMQEAPRFVNDIVMDIVAKVTGGR